MTLLAAYARERVATRPVVSAVVLVVGAALAGRGWPGAAAAGTDVLIAAAGVVAFRIWDDLADAERDRLLHPERVLVRARSTRGLRLAAGSVALAGALLLGITGGLVPVGMAAAYAAALALTYARRRSRTAARERLVLLKYAVFTLVLIGRPGAWSARGLLAAAAAFSAACAYEWWHDAQSPVFSFGGSR